MNYNKDNYINKYYMNVLNQEVKQRGSPFAVKQRKRTTSLQLKILERAFESCDKPDSLVRQKLAEQLAMTPRSVQVWFQNRRAKMKRTQRNVIYEQINDNNQQENKSEFYDQMDKFEFYQRTYEMEYFRPYHFMPNQYAFNNNYRTTTSQNNQLDRDNSFFIFKPREDTTSEK